MYMCPLFYFILRSLQICKINFILNNFNHLITSVLREIILKTKLKEFCLFFDLFSLDLSFYFQYFVDATVSLRMHGNIPDARNAIFNIWRTYDDDLIISDVSFYLKLNHSRLVTSTLRWRPELKSDIIVR